MKLYGYWRSSASWRARIGLAWKEIPYEYVPVHLLREGGEQHGDAHRARNPMRQVPTLEWTEGGETFRVSQSMAILEYLEDRYPERPLLPKTPFLRAKARQLAEIVNSGIQPLQNLSVLARLDAHGVDKAAWLSEWIGRGLNALETAAREVSGKYSVGDDVSIADACLVPQMYAARRFGVDLEPYPTLRAIEAACEALPAFRAAHADSQPDAPESKP